MKAFIISWIIMWFVWSIVILGLVSRYQEELYKKGILEYRPNNPSNNELLSYILILIFLPLTGPIFIIAIKRFLEQ